MAQDPIAARSDALHRHVAERLRHEPQLVEVAKQRIERWIARDGDSAVSAWLEWRDALRLLDIAQLADFLESTTPRARRMRVSSPFAGLAR